MPAFIGGTMITYKELLSGHSIVDLTINQQQNLQELQDKMNQVRSLWGRPMLCTSGFRSLQDHLRIYSQIAHRKGVPFDPKKVPMGSAHLKACAVDILDEGGELMKWCRANEDKLTEIGLWIEDDTSVPRVHFQTYPPASGRRFFKP